MVNGGLIIRLVDVVLIILLGFLTISDFSLKTQIKLETGGNETENDSEMAIITVRIMPDKTFYVEEQDQNDRVIPRSNSLEAYLVNKADEYKRKKSHLMIVIEPDLDTEIQFTVDVLDICERLQIAKTISYPNIPL